MKNRSVFEAQFFEELENYPIDSFGYKFDNDGHFIGLNLTGDEELHLDYFPEQICKLTLLKELVFSGHNVSRIPDCLANLTRLTILDLSDNNIQEFPPLLIYFPHLRELYIANKALNIPHRNLLNYLDNEIFKTPFSLKDVSAIYGEFRKREQAERDELKRKYHQREEPWNLVYPPQEVLSPPQNYDYIVLWMLNNNFACSWGDFRDEPIKMNQHLIWKYISDLSYYHLIYNVNGGYMITELGKKRLREIESERNNK